MKTIKRTWWILGGILACGLLLRLANIQAEPFWSDELLSLDIFTSFSSMAEMVQYLRQVEFHPPLYYVLMRPWAVLFGTSHIAIRLVSVFFGMGVIGAVFFWTRKLLKNDKTALLAAFLVAVLPFQIEFSQEARPYIIFTFFGIIAAWAMWEYLRTQKKLYAVWYVIAILAGMYLHYSFVFLAVALGAWWLVDVLHKKSKKRSAAFIQLLIVHSFIFIGYWWWMDALLYKTILANFELLGEIRQVPSIRPFAFVPRIFDGLIWIQSDTFVPIHEVLLKFITTIAVGITVFSLGKDKILSTGKKILKWYKNPVVFLAWLIVVPTLFFVVSPQSIPYTNIYQRHVIFITVPMMMLLAHVLNFLELKKGALLLVLVVMSFMPTAFQILENDVNSNVYFQHEVEGNFLTEHWKEGDMVIVWTTNVRTHIARYLPQDAVVEAIHPLGYFDNGIDPWRTHKTLGLIENEMQVRGITILTGNESTDGVMEKMQILLERHQPKRVWIYASSSTLSSAYHEKNWRWVYRSVYPLFRLDLFENPLEIVVE